MKRKTTLNPLDPGYFLDFSRFTPNASRLPLERAMGFEPTTASLEGWNSTTELRPPVFFPRPATHNCNLELKQALDSQVVQA